MWKCAWSGTALQTVMETMKDNEGPLFIQGEFLSSPAEAVGDRWQHATVFSSRCSEPKVGVQACCRFCNTQTGDLHGDVAFHVKMLRLNLIQP